MNILPKKRWHVRTKDNVAKVKRDEKKAAEEEKAAKDRAALAEQEYRTGILRERAASKFGFADVLTSHSSGGASNLEIEQPSGHINLFADMELEENQEALKKASNKDYEKDKKLELEDWQRKIGVFKYLGEGSSEYMKEVPWYQKAKLPTIGEGKSANVADLNLKTAKGDDTPSASRTVEPPAKYRKLNTTGCSNLPSILTRATNNLASVASANTVILPSDLLPKISTDHRRSADIKKSRKKKHKKDKRRNLKHDGKHENKTRKRHKRRRSESASTISDDNSSNNSVEAISAPKMSETEFKMLREERLKRESVERMRAERLLRQAKGLPEEEEKVKSQQPRKQKYNSQFNPEFARQNAKDD